MRSVDHAALKVHVGSLRRVSVFGAFQCEVPKAGEKVQGDTDRRYIRMLDGSKSPRRRSHLLLLGTPYLLSMDRRASLLPSPERLS